MDKVETEQRRGGKKNYFKKEFQFILFLSHVLIYNRSRQIAFTAKFVYFNKTNKNKRNKIATNILD